MTATRVGGVAHRTQQRGQGIPVGSARQLDLVCDRDSQLTSIAFFEFQIYGRELYRQPTRGRFCTVGTIVIIHRCGLRDRSSWTDRTMPKNLDPFKLSSAARPLYWARRQRVASRKLFVSTVCTMTSSGQARNGISQTLTLSFSFGPVQLPPCPPIELTPN